MVEIIGIAIDPIWMRFKESVSKESFLGFLSSSKISVENLVLNFIAAIEVITAIVSSIVFRISGFASIPVKKMSDKQKVEIAPNITI